MQLIQQNVVLLQKEKIKGFEIQNNNIKMTKAIKFTKMQGAGNDYIYVYRENAQDTIADPVFAAQKWSNRHTGIGSDGLVLISRSPVPEADFAMRIFNADGSEALMCGNASRCIGKYVYEKGLTKQTFIKLLTQSGIRTLKLHIGDDNRVERVTVDMQEPCFADCSLLSTTDGSMLEGSVTAHGQELRGTFVSMGNPHFVIFSDDAEAINVSLLGNALETDSLFPQRCNIEFATPLGNGCIRTRVWERGSGITQACGTGACATAVAAAQTGRAGRKSTIIMDGGTLDIEWNPTDNHVYMTGPAEFVFEGEIELS